MNGVFKSILRLNDSLFNKFFLSASPIDGHSARRFIFYSVNSFYFGHIVSCLFVMVTFIQGKYNKLPGLFQMYKYKCTPLPGDSR